MGFCLNNAEAPKLAPEIALTISGAWLTRGGMNTKPKRGRKPNPYTAADGRKINGLRKRKDGRWILSNGKTFTEPDEAKAIEKARKLLAGHTSIDTWWDEREAYNYAVANQGRIDWALVAEEIRTRPKWVSEQTGIEQIAYLTDLQAPEPLPSFAELEKVWEDYYPKKEQKRRVLTAWKDFVSTAKVADLREITPQTAIAYRDAVWARKLSGKSQNNRFTRIRRFISFCKDRAIAMDALNKTLVVLSLLKPSESGLNFDPHPVEPEDFRKMLDKAKGTDDEAMLLLMLNCAMYLEEVVNVKWDHIKKANGYVGNRNKTAKCLRVGVLWDETMKAIEALPRKGEHLFYGSRGKPITCSGMRKRWRLLREAAKVPWVQPSHLRDGAIQAMSEAGVSEKLSLLVEGHRAAGMSDHYVKRNPAMVAPACEAIHRAYFPKKESAAAAA